MSRSPLIEGIDLNTIQDFEIDTIRPDAIPEKVINAVRLALQDGEKLVGQHYVNKRITVRGHFYAADRATYESRRDDLLGLLDHETVVKMIFEQSGEDRRYFGTYENVTFDYKDNGFCMVTILFRCTDPFGETVAESTFFNGNVTDEITQVIDTGGNIYGLPKIIVNINSIDDDEIERNLSLTISQGTKSYNIQINRVWQLNDTLTIDSKKQRVYVNGQQVEFTGLFPQVLKTNTFRFNMTDAASFDVDILITYNKRWL